MTGDTTGRIGRTRVPALTGTPTAAGRRRTSDEQVEAASHAGSFLGDGGERQSPENQSSDRDPSAPPAGRHAPRDDDAGSGPPAAPDQAHPLVYVAIDTVTGKVLWRVRGDGVPAGQPQKPLTYGPRATLAYGRDEDDTQHGISRLI